VEIAPLTAARSSDLIPVSPWEGSTMAEEGNERRRSWLSDCVALLAVLVLYALSAGPAALIVVKTDAGREVAEVVYAPLALLRLTPLGRPMDAYMVFWARRLGKGETLWPTPRE
jgi:hypothetical protein